MSLPRSGLALLVAASVALAGCTGATDPSPTRSEAPTPSVPASPEASHPAPSEPGAFVWSPVGVPAPRLGSAVVGIVPGGEGLVAFGFDGGVGSILWTSPDGRSWRDITPEGFESIGIAGMANANGLLVGVGRGDTINVDADLAAVLLSDDGLTWRQAEGGDQMRGQMIDVVATADGLYAAGGHPGADAAAIWHSTDGETWQPAAGDFDRAYLWAIAEGGPGLVAVGWRRPGPDVAVWTSPDGVTWTLSPVPEGFARFEATDVVSTADGRLVMVGSSLSGDAGQIWHSGDGITWELAEVAGGMEGAYARSLAVTPAGIVAVGGSAAMEGRAWHSTDGRTLSPLGDPVPNAFFNGALVSDDALLVSGGTQTGTYETGIDIHAMIWSATVD